MLLFMVSRGLPALMAWERSQHARAAGALHDRAELDLGRRHMVEWVDTLHARRTRLIVLDSLLLRGETPAIAAAELASTVGDLADRAKLRVNAIQPRGDTIAHGALAEVAVRVNAVGDVYGLMAFLREIESDRALLAVRELTVTQPEPASVPARPEQLRIEVLVQSIVRITAGGTT